MKITASKEINIYQLIVHGDFYDYKKGSYMLSLLELANAYGQIDVKTVNRILLGGELFQVAESLVRSTVVCELLESKENEKYVLTEYGKGCLAESHAWSPLYKSTLSIGILDFIFPGSTESYHLYPVARVDKTDWLDDFNSIDSDRLPAAVSNFVNILKQKSKWTAFTNRNDSPNSDGRSFSSLLILSEGGQIFWDRFKATVSVKWTPKNSSDSGFWTIENISPMNLKPTPLKKLLEQMSGEKIKTEEDLDLVNELAERGFILQPNGSFIYTKGDEFERKVINISALNFVQRIQMDDWSYKVEGKLIANTLEQALKWYFGGYFQCDAVVEISELRRDFKSYALEAGQVGDVSDEQLYDAYKTWSSSPNRAAKSRRGFFLHFS